MIAEEELTVSATGQDLLRQLLIVWLEFERRIGRLPMFNRLEQGNFTIEDYKNLLFNLRAQVVEGSRWITRAASSFTADFRELRSTVIHHALDEHRDYEMLERDYVSIGGEQEDIINAPRNIGTEALAAFMMQQASQPNPIDLLGAVFIIEGLGQKMAGPWAEQIQEQLNIGPESTTFLSYHGKNDDTHIGKMHAVLNSKVITPELVPRVVKTARVVARLYALQLEELNQH